jgi:hypothetical protein
MHGSRHSHKTTTTPGSRRNHALLAVLLTAQLMVILDITAVNIALPSLARDLELSNDPTLPPGTFAWFQAFDNGEGANAPADRSSLIGFGTEGANEAFCNSPNLPRNGPWDVDGNVQVRGG